MSTDMSEHHDETDASVEGAAPELRARYLPVSRRELRRRREASASPGTSEETPISAAQASVGVADVDEAKRDRSAPDDRSAQDDELARFVHDADAVESPDLPASHSTTPAEVGTRAPEAETEPEVGAASAPEFEPPTTVLPAVTADDEPARPEEEIAEADHGTEEAEPHEPSSADSGELDAQVTAQTLAAQPDVEFPTEEAPIPASRRARRLLRDTSSIPAVDPELMAEIQATTAEVSRLKDPNKVDPELLRRQHALASRAMAANQRQREADQAAIARDAAARNDLAARHGSAMSESEVITGRTLRDEPSYDAIFEDATGQIEPVHASGAHGLELRQYIDATSRSSQRQAMLTGALFVLSFLLIIATGLAIYFIIM